MKTHGIDILICRGPRLEAVVAALQACGVPLTGVVQPGESDTDWAGLFAHRQWARLHVMHGEDFGWKADIGARGPLNGLAFARALAEALGNDVVVLDERKPDPFSAVRLRPGAPDAEGRVIEMEPGGYAFIPPPGSA